METLSVINVNVLYPDILSSYLLVFSFSPIAFWEFLRKTSIDPGASVFNTKQKQKFWRFLEYLHFFPLVHFYGFLSRIFARFRLNTSFPVFLWKPRIQLFIFLTYLLPLSAVLFLVRPYNSKELRESCKSFYSRFFHTVFEFIPIKWHFVLHTFGFVFKCRPLSYYYLKI